MEKISSPSCCREPLQPFHQKLPVVLKPFVSDVYLADAVPALVSAKNSGTEARSILTRLATRIGTPEPEIETALQKANERLAAKGLPPVDFVRVTREIESIARDPNRTDKEKRAAMNEVRKKLGLKKGEMKKIFTRRLANLYADAVRDLRSVEGSNPSLIRLREQIEGTQKLYQSMYKSGGCIKKVFSGIGKIFKAVVKPSLLKTFILSAANLIPGVGPIVAKIIRWVTIIKQGVDAAEDAAKGRI